MIDAAYAVPASDSFAPPFVLGERLGTGTDAGSAAPHLGAALGSQIGSYLGVPGGAELGAQFGAQSGGSTGAGIGAGIGGHMRDSGGLVNITHAAVCVLCGPACFPYMLDMLAAGAVEAGVQQL